MEMEREVKKRKKRTNKRVGNRMIMIRELQRENRKIKGWEIE